MRQIIKNGLTALMLLTVCLLQAQINIYVKKTGSTSIPKIHAWSNDTGVDVPITTWGSLPSMTATTNGWYKYTAPVGKKNIGVLFIIDNIQSNDFKYYTKDTWIVLNTDGKTGTPTNYNPDIVTLPVPKYSFDKTPRTIVNQAHNFNGYDAPIKLTITSVSASGTPNTVIYTDNGTDVSCSTSNKQNFGTPITVDKSTSFAAKTIGGSQYTSSCSTQANVQVNFLRNVNPSVTVTAQPCKSYGKYTLIIDKKTNDAVYYTTDGSDPISSSTKKTYDPLNSLANQFDASVGVTFKAVGVVFGSSTIYSQVITKEVKFAEPSLEFVTSPQPQANGKFKAGTTVEVTINPSVPCYVGQPIYYTTDGTFPYYATSTAKLYDPNNKPKVNVNTTITAAVYLGGGYRDGVYTKPFKKDIVFENPITINPPTLTTDKSADIYVNTYRYNGYDAPVKVKFSSTSNGGTPLPIIYTDNGTTVVCGTNNKQINSGGEITVYTSATFSARTLGGSQYAPSCSEERSIGIVFYPNVNPVITTDATSCKNGNGFSVSIDKKTNNVLYYTTDGTDPLYSSTRTVSEAPITTIYYAGYSAPSSVTIRAVGAVFGRSTIYSQVVTKEIKSDQEPVLNFQTTPVPQSNGKFKSTENVIVKIIPSGSCYTGQSIYYTLDGTYPAYSTTGKLYDSINGIQIPAGKNTTITAAVYLGGGWRYGVYTKLYTKEIKFEGPVDIKFSVDKVAENTDGTYKFGDVVNLSISPNYGCGGCLAPTIYYTLDGSDPVLSTNRKTYSSPIKLEKTTLVRAVSYTVEVFGPNAGKGEYGTELSKNYIFRKITATPDKAPNANGFYSLGTTVNYTLYSEVKGEKTTYGGRYFRYTTDGSDPKLSGTVIVASSDTGFGMSTISISNNCTLRIIETASGGTQPYSNQVTIPIKFLAKSTLNVNETLSVGQYLDSPNGKYRLIMKSDGNLVLSDVSNLSWINLWETKTSGTAANRLAMQGDGNLVLYDATNKAYFDTRTYGRSGAITTLNDDGSLTVKLNGTVIWSTKSAFKIYVKREPVYGSNYNVTPRIHLWTPSGANLTTWGSLPIMNIEPNGWYSYEVKYHTNINNVFYWAGDNKQSSNNTNISKDTYFLYDSNVNLKQRSESSLIYSTNSSATVSSITLAPSTASTFVNIQYPFTGTKTLQIGIYNTSGNSIYNKTSTYTNGLNENISILNLNTINGVHIMRIIEGSNIVNKNFIINK